MKNPERWHTKLGRDLVVGDIIAPWFERTARINQIGPYTGSLAHLWRDQGGARIAELIPCAVDGGKAFMAAGITVEPLAHYRVWRP